MFDRERHGLRESTKKCSDLNIGSVTKYYACAPSNHTKCFIKLLVKCDTAMAFLYCAFANRHWLPNVSAPLSVRKDKQIMAKKSKVIFFGNMHFILQTRDMTLDSWRYRVVPGAYTLLHWYE